MIQLRHKLGDIALVGWGVCLLAALVYPFAWAGGWLVGAGSSGVWAFTFGFACTAGLVAIRGCILQWRGQL